MTLPSQVEEAIRVKLEECNGPVVELGGTDAVPADDCDKVLNRSSLNVIIVIV